MLNEDGNTKLLNSEYFTVAAVSNPQSLQYWPLLLEGSNPGFSEELVLTVTKQVLRTQPYDQFLLLDL
jgi:hypothetical protein